MPAAQLFHVLRFNTYAFIESFFGLKICRKNRFNRHINAIAFCHFPNSLGDQRHGVDNYPVPIEYDSAYVCEHPTNIAGGTEKSSRLNFQRSYLWAAIGNRTRIESSTSSNVNRYTIAAMLRTFPLYQIRSCGATFLRTDAEGGGVNAVPRPSRPKSARRQR